MVGLDASILMNPKVWEASGHVSSFSDPLVDCRKCKYRDRADKLIEEHINKNSLTLEQVREKIDVDNMTPEAWTFDQQTAFLAEFKVKCPKCGSCDWTEPKKFNLMFKTQQ
jgi:glycyl-tRNA synthetase